MKEFPKAPFAVFLGAVVGCVVLGLVGRGVTAGLALSMGREANLSLNGLVESAIVGAVFGAVGGLLLLPVRKLVPAAGAGRGLLLGLLLFLGSLLLTRLLGRAAFDSSTTQALTLGVVAVVYIAYGVVLDGLFSRSVP